MYSGRSSPVVVATKRDGLAQTIAANLKCEALPLRAGLGKRYSWSQLYEHRAIVVIPYNVSIMSVFEHYSACAPIYVPTRDFLKRLMKQYPDEVLSDLSFAQVTGRPAVARPHIDLDLNDVRDEQVVDWYLDRADFYDPSWMPSIRQFESWPHLDHLLEADDQLSISQQMASEKPQRVARISSLWDGVEWLRRIAAADGQGQARRHATAH